MLFRKYTSPNYGERAEGAKPSMIILHYTDMLTARGALKRLCDPASQVSAHYFVEENGKVRQLVPDDKRAWHAGKSSWAGESDINSHSIGIEIVNPGHSCGYRAFPDRQIVAVIRLCTRLMAKHGIAVDKVLAHSDVAPGRKIDPGELFPWQRLAEEGVGVWPKPDDMDYAAAEDILRQKDVFFEMLGRIGYDLDAGEGAVTSAFHRHFYPEKFKAGENPEEVDILSVIRVLALLRACMRD